MRAERGLRVGDGVHFGRADGRSHGLVFDGPLVGKLASICFPGAAFLASPVICIVPRVVIGSFGRSALTRRTR